jgi:hypothetical protein
VRSGPYGFQVQTLECLLFISNKPELPSPSSRALYQARWHVELFFSLDQNAFAHKSILRHLGKRNQVANLDRYIGLRARRNHQEAPQPVSKPVRDITNLELQPVQENFARCITVAIPTILESAQDGSQLILL